MEGRRKRREGKAPKRREREERDVILRCPFCKTPVQDIVEIETPFHDTVDGGRCGCGSVFVYDRSGRRLGEAFSEALAFAYDWDYDAAFGAGETEYEESVVRYDSRFRKYFYSEGGVFDRSPRFYFVRRIDKLKGGV